MFELRSIYKFQLFTAKAFQCIIYYDKFYSKFGSILCIEKSFLSNIKKSNILLYDNCIDGINLYDS